MATHQAARSLNLQPIGSLPFSAADVEREFTTGTLQRGRNYAVRGAVRDVELSVDGRVLRAKVRGSRPKPYTVTVAFRGSSPGQIHTTCTCPVGFACKHAAAAMLALLGGDAALAAPAPRPVDPLAGPVGLWLDTLSAAAAPAQAGASAERVLYVLDRQEGGPRPEARIEILAARSLKAGGYGAGRSYDLRSLMSRSARFVTDEDSLIGQLLANGQGYPRKLPPDPLRLDHAFQRMVATGRCHFRSKDSPPLAQGPARRGRLGWTLGPQGEQVPVAQAEEPDLIVLDCAAPWYIDVAAGLTGPLRFDQTAPVVAAFLRAPPVLPEQGAALRGEIDARLAGHAIPPPRVDIEVVVVSEPPLPRLLLATEQTPVYRLYSGSAEPDAGHDIACLTFDYGGVIVGDDRAEELRRAEGERIVVRRRHARAERGFRDRLKQLGFAATAFLARDPKLAQHIRLDLPQADHDGWRRFVHRAVPALREEGWQVDFDPSFRHRVVEAADDWEATLGEGSGWWFSLELGVEVEGERISLLPLLAEAVRRMKAAPNGAAMLPDAALYAPLPGGRVLALPMERVQPMLAALIELSDMPALSRGGGMDVSLAQAAALAAIAEATRLRWLGDARLLELVAQLRNTGGIEELAPAPAFRAELRPYQRRGLGWLRLVAKHGLGGILADDMGLGKTIQTLAHVQAERHAGRLNGPVLVVCPTSLIPNWEREAQRFAPELTVLRLHGPNRAGAFGGIGEADLVLSTYALLPRDAHALLAVEWQLVVLDEAQAIKNPTSKATQFACRLKAKHRLCLTGTPIENHLGELWSQFAFLMPGLLGEQRRFAKLFRTPIEKRGDQERRAALSARLRPFMLRRTKEQVAPELPPRTEIVRRVALAGDQRDLYETVRLVMHEKIRREIAARGFERSRIVVLDALLKLRQVCCDPRLVKLAAARKVTSSSKLADLLEMLPELLDEGRRVLLFSQFTSMLDLVLPELDRLGIPYVELRGDTVDRLTPVAHFQAGKVPLFVLSLKAGGVGLNLTAADTVILYDPWWNPAVEAQAADRAHRIGQDKPVFIYKLIAEGTIEERMLELQERKRALAEQVLDDKGTGFTGFTQADLDDLLRPLDR